MTQNSINNSASSFTVDNLLVDGNTISTTNTNGDLIIAPDGSGTVSITASSIVPSGDRADSLGSSTNSWDNVYADGISFDDGTSILGNFVDKTSWTPTITIFGGGGGGATYTTQDGYYSRIGNMIFATFNVAWSTHTSAGFIILSGLPILGATYKSLGASQWFDSSALSTNPLWGCMLKQPGTFDTQLPFIDTSGTVIGTLLFSPGGVKGSLWYFV